MVGDPWIGQSVDEEVDHRCLKGEATFGGFRHRDVCIGASNARPLNWLLFVWAVVHDRVLATSLGYFITPLVNILLGNLFLHERLTGNQKIAVAIAALGTVYLAWYLGQPPWISLSLAFLFGTYGLLRKRLTVGPMTGLMWENMLLLGMEGHREDGVVKQALDAVESQVSLFKVLGSYPMYVSSAV